MDSRRDSFDEYLESQNEDFWLALSLQNIENEELLNRNNKPIDNHMIENDRLIAEQLTEELNRDKEKVEVDSGKFAHLSVVSPELELLDPSPNIWHLMRDFDQRFFSGVLAKHCIELSWSPRMTRTAGLCAWSPQTNYCSIRLSLPLLQLRSRRDLVETLIHEMIHALLFVSREDDNHESHGPLFHSHMYRINKESGANITVYHDFHEEVKHFLKHVWRCDGVCRERSPYFGYVRRAMNRKPGPSDYWFKYHAQTCGGNFIKLSEPSSSGSQSSKPAKKIEVLTPESQKNHDIRDYFSPQKTQPKTIVTSAKVVPFSGTGYKLGFKTESTKSAIIGDKNSLTNNMNRPSTSKSTPGNNFTARNDNFTNIVPTVSGVNSSNQILDDLDAKLYKYSSYTNIVPFSGAGHALGSSSNWEKNSAKPKRKYSDINVIDITESPDYCVIIEEDQKKCADNNSIIVIDLE